MEDHTLGDVNIKEHCLHLERSRNTNTGIKKERSSNRKIRIIITFSFMFYEWEIVDLSKFLKCQLDLMLLYFACDNPFNIFDTRVEHPHQSQKHII